MMVPSLDITKAMQSIWVLLPIIFSVIISSDELHFSTAFAPTRSLQSTSSQKNINLLSAVKTASSSSAEGTTSSRLKRTSSFTDWAKENDIK